MKPSEQSHYEGTEPVRGLPERLPAGERMLWQGAPEWRSLVRHTFHVRKLTAYFAVLLAWDAVSTLIESGSLADQAMPMLQLAGLAAIVIGMVTLFSVAVARTTVYTLTSRRLVIRAGIALPMTINIPYRRLASAGLKLNRDGSGDLLLTPIAGDKIAYLALWPHVQAWHLSNARPMLRAILQPASVARILGEAMAAECADDVVRLPRSAPIGRTRPADAIAA